MTRDRDADATPSAGQDLVGGLLTIAFGGFALSKALSYPMGSALRMGPGFFPAILSCLIIVLGVALALHALQRRMARQAIEVRLRPVVTIAIAVAAFALMLERFGIVPATIALVLISSLAASRLRLWRSLILAVVMTGAVYVIFIVVLQMPLTVMNW